MIGGHTINRLTRNLYSCASQAVVESFYAYYNRDPERAALFTSNNLAIPSALYRELGGFNSNFRIASEDRDLCDRWLAAGYAMAYANDVVVYHEHDLTFHSFCRQHFRYGRGGAQYYLDRPRNTHQNLASSVGFHLRVPVLLGHGLSAMGPATAFRVAPALVVWLVCNTSGFIYEMIRRKLVLARRLERAG
jgi:GT2 family glycosyltransferase